MNVLITQTLWYHSISLSDMPLSIEDLAWLMTEMGSITLKWKEIMLELSDSNKEVLAIMEGAVSPYSRLNKGITRWLHQTSPTPTLRALARALRSNTVKESGVASDIMKGKQCVKLIICSNLFLQYIHGYSTPRIL